MNDIRKLLETISLLEAQEGNVTVTITADMDENFKNFVKFFEFLKTANTGTGITLTAVDNGGEKVTAYIDGDGADRIISVEVKTKTTAD